MKIAAGGVALLLIAVGILPTAGFEKIALVDSLDDALKWDVETPSGTIKVLDDAQRPH